MRVYLYGLVDISRMKAAGLPHSKQFIWHLSLVQSVDDRLPRAQEIDELSGFAASKPDKVVTATHRIPGIVHVQRYAAGTPSESSKALQASGAANSAFLSKLGSLSSFVR